MLCSGVVAAVGGCAAPGPLVRLEPATAASLWIQGVPAVEKEAAGVRVVAAFSHQEGDRLAMNVLVENRTTEALEANPRDMSYSACVTERSASCATARYAIDPEQVIESLQVEQSRQAADAQGSEGVTSALVVLSAVLDIATIASGRANRRTGLGTANAIYLNESVRASNAYAGAGLARARERWSSEALRRTTVQPGAYAFGRVYVPVNLEAGYVWFHVRAGGQVISFKFRQAVKHSLTGPETPADFRRPAG